jgi:hypothetical protein
LSEAAFAPESLETGAVISYRGDELVASGEQIIAALEREVTGSTAPSAHADRWLMDAVPMLARGGALIVPLSWEPPHPVAHDLRARAGELWSSIRGACEFRHGTQIGIDLAPNREAGGSYAAELARTGARRADWWAFGTHAVVLVVYGLPLPEPVSLTAVHVVPRSWVWDDAARDRASSNTLRTGDLGWSWGDVVAFAAVSPG